MGVLLIYIYRLVDIQLEDPTVISSFRTFLFIFEDEDFSAFSGVHLPAQERR